MHDPFARFQAWFAEVQSTPSITEPTAMTLATLGSCGTPRARVVLLKDVSQQGFTFYTNHESDKGRELYAHPQASLLFYWMPLKRQVRIEGRVAPVSDAEADTYFASRVRGSQIGAWASAQSRPLASIEQLQAEVHAIEERFANQRVPRPPYWSGFRLTPHRVEFWEERPFRLHTRDIYTHNAQAGWQLSHLYP